jgi:hypothetical protein
MKKSILLECDSFTIQKLKHWIQTSRLNQFYNVFILTFDSRNENFKKDLEELENVICVSYSFITNYKPKKNIKHFTYTTFVSTLLNDHITARLTDRESLWPKEYGIGIQNAFSFFTFSSYRILSFLLDKKIEIVYFRNSPHLPKEWIIAKAAEHLNVDVYVTERYIFPFLYSISKGFQKERKCLLDNKAFNNLDDLQYHISNLVESIKGDYANAIPSYEKKRQGKGVLKFYNPFKNKRQSLKRPDNFWNKTKLFFYYKKHRKYIDLENTDYVIFYLHYQPERTTLPEGYDFADQFYAIDLLSRMLPEGIKLLVKEHPSMFTVTSNVKARNLYNYKQILKLDNVILCPMDEDNFKLIDNAKAISTITGNVALEAYIRKTPVILFGRSLLNLKGVHIVDNICQLENFITQVCNDEVKIENIVETLVELCSKNNISGLDLTSRENIDYHNFKGFQENAHYKLLEEVLINQNQKQFL